MTWPFTAVEGGTRVEIRADDVPTGITAEDHAAGMASSLANLAAYVASRWRADIAENPGPRR